MDIREFSRAYARSPLGILSIFAALAAGTAAGLLGLPPVFASLVALGAFAALLFLALGLGFGQRAAVAEADRAALSNAASRLAEAARAAARLASMRLGQADLASARDLLVLEAGRFIEGCRRVGSYDPEAVAAVQDSLTLVDAWLREADESSIEKRFDLPDANPFPEAVAATAKALRDKAVFIAARRARIVGEVSGADQIAIEEELK